MKLEIERKFLVLNDDWRPQVFKTKTLRDGLIGDFGGRKVRVRIDEASAWLTVKGSRIGLGRREFEYEIPREEAETMLREVCTGCLVQKTRNYVTHEGSTWEIDVYAAELAGIVLAEVELTSETQDFIRPSWIGREVTGESQYRLSTLLKICGDTRRTLSVAELVARAAAAPTGPDARCN